MKKTLFVLSLIGCVPAVHAAVGDTYDLTQGYIAEGVSATFSDGVIIFGRTEIANSTRFYDSQKGWVGAGRYDDSYMCWAHTASNMIQYWQSYYGVFCKSDVSTLPYGSDYKRELYNAMNPSNSPVITDPMRLNVMKALYNSGFSNMGGEVATGTNWFFTWVDSQGGYYSEYFGAIHNGQSNPLGHTATITGVNSLSTLKSALLPALGLTESNGTYTQTESGLIAHLNVTDGSNPHTLTCYGLTMNADGSIKSVIIADSDDCKLRPTDPNTSFSGPEGTYMPKLTQLYVKVDENGKLMLFSDEACGTPFISGYSYYVAGITQINTPEVLQNMLAEYSDVANEAQVWNGNSNEWKAQVATTEELPTESTGWDVLVDGDNIAEEHRGYYHAYSTDGRAVVFGAHGMNGRTSTQIITVSGTVTPGAITVENGGDYHLKAGTGAAIAGTGDVAVNNGGKLSSELNFGTRAIKVASGGHFAYAMTADTVLTGQISGEKGSVVQFRNGSSTRDVTYSYNMSDYRLASNTVNAIKGTLVVGDASDSRATNVDFSSAYYGYLAVENLVLYENASLNTAGTTVVTDTYSSLRGLQSAATFSVRAAATAPVLNDSLDLTKAHTLVMETATNLNGNKLLLFTSNILTLQMELSELEDNVLFTNVSAVTVDDSDYTTDTTWDATTFFSGENMQNYDLVFANGNVSLVYAPMVPEPTTATLSLLALAALTMRRRRK